MKQGILIIGDSGTGKSTSIRNLPHNETFIINVTNKPLPFRGSSKLYVRLSPDGLTGNYYNTDDLNTITRIINMVNAKRKDIKYLIIDDFGYTMSNHYLKNAMVKGFDKFANLGVGVASVFEAMNGLRDDLYCVLMMHTEIDNVGKIKPKTVGKMIDNYINIEGKFTIVFHSVVTDGQYQFITNNDGQHMAKTPMGMFNSHVIPNDLFSIVTEINHYYIGDIDEQVMGSDDTVSTAT